MIPSDSQHSFTCIISSINLAKYYEWKDTNLIYLSILLLDAVATEFVEKAKNITGMECAVRFTEKARALGLGALGFATLLQEKMIPYDSLTARHMARIVFGHIKSQSDFASAHLAEIYGKPEWCKNSPYRNMTRRAIAPNRTSAVYSGMNSQGIMMEASNAYSDQTAKGTFFVFNKNLAKLLKEKGVYSNDLVKSIRNNNGSVQHLECLTQEEKDVFKTREEVDQRDVIKLVAVIQEYIDQGISCNLFFKPTDDPKYIYDTHVLAWKLGLKSLYYLKSRSNIAVETVTKASNFNKDYECKSCEA